MMGERIIILPTDLFTPTPDVAGFGVRSRRLRGWVNSSAPSAIRNVPPHLGAALRGAKVCGLVPLSARRGAVAGLRARGCGSNTRGQEATGYHYRILDPIADDAGGDELRHLWRQHRDLDFWWPDQPEALPEHIVTLTQFKAKAQYERLKQTVKALRQVPVASPRLYEFVLDDRQSFGGWIMLHIDGRFHFICERGKLHEEASARRNIVLALNAEWDVKRHRRLGLAARAKALKLSDAYPHMAAFANQPYKHVERANAAFVDPKDWIPSTSRRTPAHPAEARLVRETQSAMTPARLDYLQRQAIVTTRPIRCGEEILVEYNRDWRV